MGTKIIDTIRGLVSGTLEICKECDAIVPKYDPKSGNDDEYYAAHNSGCIYKIVARELRIADAKNGLREKPPER